VILVRVHFPTNSSGLRNRAEEAEYVLVVAHGLEAEYVLVVAHGLIVRVFDAEQWLPAENLNTHSPLH
jgi:hypothetical protein